MVVFTRENRQGFVQYITRPLHAQEHLSAIPAGASNFRLKGCHFAAITYCKTKRQLHEPCLGP